MNPARPVIRRAPAATDSSPQSLLTAIYAARGASAEIDRTLPLSALEPVGSLGNVNRAAELILKHRRNRILVVGDFDADGATSVALLLRCLNEFGFEDVRYLVPNRFEFGYGLSAGLAPVALTLEPDLVITVDNGISSVRGIAALRSQGVDVLVTDHHLPPDALPDATEIVNPNMPGDAFASKALAGVGVAFYLMAALGRLLTRSTGEPAFARSAARYLDLVALGTIADVVRLDRNNRILVNAGLKRIRQGASVPGLLALLANGRRDFRRAVAADLGFIAGPRLNAAGRMQDMSVGIEALLTDDPQLARRLATELGEINRARRTEQASMNRDALESLDRLTRDGLAGCLTLFEPGWHQGIVGLVASRIKEKTQRPVFAFARADDQLLKGSGRSVNGVHLRDLLAYVDARHPGLIERFGGHAMAAGLTLREDSLDEFRDAAASAADYLFPDADFDGAWVSDGPLGPDAMTLDTARALRDAGPWGQGFEEPLFDGRFNVASHRIVGETHLRLSLQTPCGAATLPAIAFGQAELVPSLTGGAVDVVYRLDVNDYRGIESAQLIVEQLVPIQPSP